MKRCWVAFLFVFALVASAQNTSSESTRHEIQKFLGFEQQADGEAPTGWWTNPPGTVSADSQVVHSGKWAVCLERNAASQGAFSVITKVVPVDFAGGTIELRGFLRLKDVSGDAGLWMREDDEGGAMLKLENMESQRVKGTRDWAEYSIQLPVESAACKLFFGVLVEGTGTLWADDLQLLVDGKPIADAPEAPARLQTAFDADHEFDKGSTIHLDSLSAMQTENLAALARVWGFLKYHHPAVAGGQRQWDYDLFRILPAVLAAPDRPHANNALLTWIDSLGPVPACKSCAQLSLNGLDVKPDIDWIHDELLLGVPLAERLERIYASRPKNQFYVSLMPGVGNPKFDHELSYPDVQFPDSGFQLLALFRWWNIMQYWAPYRANQDWPAVLAGFIPKVTLSKDKDAYALAMMELIAKANDTHANLWSSLNLSPPTGVCALPVTVRFVDNLPVIAAVSPNAKEPVSLQLGDTIESLDGVSVSKLVADWTPLYADSNAAARQRDMGRQFTRGACGPSTIQVRRGGKPVTLTSTRVEQPPRTKFDAFHDRPGDTFQLLSPQIAYLKLSSIKAVDVAGYIEKAKNTKGLIIDIRNYPSEFMPFTLGPLLVDQPTPFAAFSFPELDNPGAFRFGPGPSISPGPLHYKGKIVILVDEVSQSQAEYTAMALRATPGAIVVGSTTAGADGNVSQIPLPGALHTMVSGIGVFYPNHRPTQRIGIIPDVEAKPTPAGIIAGRDEVLETSIRQILGAATPQPEIERMATPSR